jgi:hypothetical protein
MLTILRAVTRDTASSLQGRSYGTELLLETHFLFHSGKSQGRGTVLAGVNMGYLFHGLILDQEMSTDSCGELPPNMYRTADVYGTT